MRLNLTDAPKQNFQVPKKKLQAQTNFKLPGAQKKKIRALTTKPAPKFNKCAPPKTFRCPKKDYGAQNFKIRRKKSPKLVKASMPALAPQNPKSQARKKNCAKIEQVQPTETFRRPKKKKSAR